MAELFLVLVLGLVFALAGGYCLVPALKRWGGKQYEREELQESHAAKIGTPTMGGITFLPAVALALALVTFGRSSPAVALFLLALVSFGAIGFVDDYLQGKRGGNLGLKARHKLALQILASAGLAWAAWCLMPEAACLLLPGGAKVALGAFAPLVGLVVFVASTNAVNLTDGLDGLASSTVALCAFGGALLCLLQGQTDWALALAALAGVSAGFLWFNAFPAQVFMGDTGALALGGALACAFFATGNALVLLVAGLVFVLETCSVILQVAWFKLTHGKRLFAMAPLHHHFRLRGWSEVQTVSRFGLVQLAAVSLALLLWRVGAG